MQNLGLHEEIAERRMERVRRRRRDHHFGVTRELNLPALARSIADPYAAQLDIIFWRDDDLGVGFEIASAAGNGIAAAKLGAPLGEDRFVTLASLARRLMGGRPGFTRHVAGHLADVTEAAPVIAGGVFAPARDGEVLPATVATPGVGHHHMVAAVGQQLHLRHRRVGAAEHPDRHVRTDRRQAHVGELGGVRKQGRCPRNTFLEQQHGRLEQTIGREPPLHRTLQKLVRQREQAHPLVMGHERPDHHPGLPASLPGRCIVDRLEEAEPAEKPQLGQSLQIAAGFFGRHHQRQRRGIGCNDQIIGKSALESQARHAEGAILVIELHVHRVVAGFRDSPGDAAMVPILDLSGHRCLAGLIEQCLLVGWHHQQRHQVLEHRTAPRQQHGFAAGTGEQTAEGEPALLRQLPLRNADETT